MAQRASVPLSEPGQRRAPPVRRVRIAQRASAALPRPRPAIGFPRGTSRPPRPDSAAGVSGAPRTQPAWAFPVSPVRRVRIAQRASAALPRTQTSLGLPRYLPSAASGRFRWRRRPLLDAALFDLPCACGHGFWPDGRTSWHRAGRGRRGARAIQVAGCAAGHGRLAARWAWAQGRHVHPAPRRLMIRWPCMTQCPQDTVLLCRAFIDRTGFSRDRGKSAQIPGFPPAIPPPLTGGEFL